MGRRSADPHWSLFEDELRPFSAREIAEALARPEFFLDEVIDETAARKMKGGDYRPRFSTLPVMSYALWGDPYHLAAAMGIVPREQGVVDRIIRLQSRVHELEKREQALDLEVSRHRNQAVGRIVDAAALTGRWAVAVWPAVEGAGPYRFHTNDRLDFTRIDGGPVTEEALHEESALTDLLFAAHAVPSPRAAPRWSAHLDDSADIATLAYSVPWLSAQFPPSTTPPAPNQLAISVIAVSVQSWARDTAGFIARILGYGLRETRAIDIETFGYTGHDDVSKRAAHARRLTFHRGMLAGPPYRYVWTHIGTPKNPRLLFPEPETWPEALMFVWVRESDELLERMVPDRAREYMDARDRVHAHIRELDEDRIIEVDAHYPAGTSAVEARGIRMVGALEIADHAVHEMVMRGKIDAASVAASVAPLAEKNRSSIAQMIYRWLDDAGRVRRGGWL